MNAARLSQRLLAEALGTTLLLATVVGSGIMAERLAGGNSALALLGNTLPTGAMLVVLVTMLAPISGAHLNPAVSLAMLADKCAGIASTGAEYVTAVDPSCLLHIEGGLSRSGSAVRAVHLADILAAQTPAPAAGSAAAPR